MIFHEMEINNKNKMKKTIDGLHRMERTVKKVKR